MTSAHSAQDFNLYYVDMGYTISDEERQRRRERVAQMREQGKFGGRQPGAGRPRKKRVSELIAEQMADEAQVIYDRFMTIVRNGQDSNAISAGRTLLDIEREERARDEKRQERVEDLRRDELLVLVAEQLKELQNAGIPGLGNIVDGEFVEVEDASTTGTRQIPSSTQEN